MTIDFVPGFRSSMDVHAEYLFQAAEFVEIVECDADPSLQGRILQVLKIDGRAVSCRTFGGTSHGYAFDLTLPSDAEQVPWMEGFYSVRMEDLRSDVPAGSMIHIRVLD